MNLTNVILNNRLLPINACIGGYIIWLMIGMQQPTTIHVQPQLFFYFSFYLLSEPIRGRKQYFLCDFLLPSSSIHVNY